MKNRRYFNGFILLAAVLLSACENRSSGSSSSSPSPSPSTTSSVPSVVSVSLSDSTPTAGQSLTLRATVRCSTSSSCRSTSISFRRDGALSIISSDTLVRTVTIPALAAGASHTATTTTTAVAGQYYGACIGADCEHSSIQVPSTTSSIWTQTSQSFTPSDFIPGAPATFTVTLRCDSSSCSSAQVDFRRSTDNIFTTSDLRLGFLTISSAIRNQSRTVTLNYTEPPGSASTYFYGICIGSDCN